MKYKEYKARRGFAGRMHEQAAAQFGFVRAYKLRNLGNKAWSGANAVLITTSL